MPERWDAVVVGGGFYGLYLAEFLAARLARVLLCERTAGLMGRASYANQARVHSGHHYPRSLLTALRSRVNYPRFVEDFRAAADTSFEAVYAIARHGSKVTAEQFAGAMQRIGAAAEPAADDVRGLFDRALVEDVFRVRECAFDAVRLKQLMADRVYRAGVEVRLGTTVTRARGIPGGSVLVETTQGDLLADTVVSCSYAETNAVAAASGLPLIPLKHELAELAVVDVPPALRDLGVTVMDGPFFSCTPFPPRGMHALTHVRYTPHGHWYDGLPAEPHLPASAVFAASEKRSAFPHMIRDAARYLPAIAQCVHRDSLWEVKTVMPRSETDDSRPILFRPDHGIPNYHVVLGGKIDNVYDVADEMAARLGWAEVRQMAGAA